MSQVSGGTGFAILERSDPETSTCGEGIELRLQCSFPSDSGSARLQLEGGEAKILEERHVKASFPLISFTTATAQRGGQAGPGTGEAGQAPIVSEMREIELTLPRQAVEYWKTEMDVPLGRDVILWTSASPGDAATLLLGRVRQVR